MKLAVESFIKNYEELYPLFEEHYHEIAMYQDKIELDVDYDRYKLFEDLESLFTVIARDDNDNIIGYSVYIINTHLHYKSTLVAVNDIIFLDPAYRKGGLGKQMVDFCDAELKKRGVHLITLHMKTFAAFEELAVASGYDKAEYIYTKCIKGEQ
jgi:GNAT superfamily N-acetyltransferase